MTRARIAFWQFVVDATLFVAAIIIVGVIFVRWDWPALFVIGVFVLWAMAFYGAILVAENRHRRL